MLAGLSPWMDTAVSPGCQLQFSPCVCSMVEEQGKEGEEVGKEGGGVGGGRGRTRGDSPSAGFPAQGWLPCRQLTGSFRDMTIALSGWHYPARSGACGVSCT